MNNVLLDSSAWIECLAGSSKGRQVQEQISPQTRIFVTGMIVAEIIAKYLREQLPTEPALQALKAHGIFVSCDLSIGEETAKIFVEQRRNKGKFGLVDAHVAAAARAIGAKLITCDTDFAGLPNVVIIK